MPTSERHWQRTVLANRPEQPDPDPRRLHLFAMEQSVADAQRALARARRIADGRYRTQLVQLEDLTMLLSHELIRDANGG
jgi:hypothetical protein